MEKNRGLFAEDFGSFMRPGTDAMDFTGKSQVTVTHTKEKQQQEPGLTAESVYCRWMDWVVCVNSSGSLQFMICECCFYRNYVKQH